MQQRLLSILIHPLGYLIFAWGCAFPQPERVTLPELLQNPGAYASQEIEVSGLVMDEASRRRDFAYWHFHLRKDDVDLICYSEAYRITAWSTLDQVIRRAAAAGKEVTVGGYVVGWGADRSVFRLRWVRYENRTYDAEFVPPVAVMG